MKKDKLGGKWNWDSKWIGLLDSYWFRKCVKKILSICLEKDVLELCESFASSFHMEKFNLTFVRRMSKRYPQ